MDELFSLNDYGLFRRSEALARGYLDRDLSRARRTGQIFRIDHGIYLPGSTWQQGDALRRHKLRALALNLSHPMPPVATHVTASVFHGQRLWRPDLRHVHVSTGQIVNARRNDRIVYHNTPVSPDAVQQIDGMRVIEPVRAAFETASLAKVEEGLCLVDGLLEDAVATIDELHAMHERLVRWPHMRKLRAVLFYARKGSQSVGETRSRFLFARYGLPEPVLQFPVAEGPGEAFAFTDFGWPDWGVLGEFDGRVKYQRGALSNLDPSEVVFLEKQREDRIREVTGFRMIRLVWADLAAPQATVSRLQSMLRRAA